MGLFDIFKKPNEKVSSETLDFREKWLSVHVALSVLENCMECDMPSEHNFSELKKSKAELLAFIKDERFDEYISKAETEFVENGHNLTTELKNFVRNPNSINPEELYTAKWEAYMLDFPIYWEQRISLLKSKSAIKKRREYLLEKTAELLEKAHALHLENSYKVLSEYISFNEKELSGI